MLIDRGLSLPKKIVVDVGGHRGGRWWVAKHIAFCGCTVARNNKISQVLVRVKITLCTKNRRFGTAVKIKVDKYIRTGTYVPGITALRGGAEPVEGRDHRVDHCSLVGFPFSEGCRKSEFDTTDGVKLSGPEALIRGLLGRLLNRTQGDPLVASREIYFILAMGHVGVIVLGVVFEAFLNTLPGDDFGGTRCGGILFGPLSPLDGHFDGAHVGGDIVSPVTSNCSSSANLALRYCVRGHRRRLSGTAVLEKSTLVRLARGTCKLRTRFVNGTIDARRTQVTPAA